MDKTHDTVASLEWGLRHAGYLLLQVTRQHLAACGLTMPRFWVLVHVEKQPDITMGELKHSMHLAGSSVSGLVDQLITDGLVRRQRDASDRRIIRLSPTPSGKQLVRETLEFRYDQIAGALEGLGAQDVQTAAGVLEQIIQAFRTALRELTDEQHPDEKTR